MQKHSLFFSLFSPISRILKLFQCSMLTRGHTKEQRTRKKTDKSHFLLLFSFLKENRSELISRTRRICSCILFSWCFRHQSSFWCVAFVVFFSKTLLSYNTEQNVPTSITTMEYQMHRHSHKLYIFCNATSNKLLTVLFPSFPQLCLMLYAYSFSNLSAPTYKKKLCT